MLTEGLLKERRFRKNPIYTFESYAQVFQLYSLQDLDHEDLTTLSSHLLYEINHGPHADDRIDRHGHALSAVQNEIQRRLFSEQAKGSGRWQMAALVGLLLAGAFQGWATLREKNSPLVGPGCPSWPDSQRSVRNE